MGQNNGWFQVKPGKTLVSSEGDNSESRHKEKRVCGSKNLNIGVDGQVVR